MRSPHLTDREAHAGLCLDSIRMMRGRLPKIGCTDGGREERNEWKNTRETEEDEGRRLRWTTQSQHLFRRRRSSGGEKQLLHEPFIVWMPDGSLGICSEMSNILSTHSVYSYP